MLSTVPIELDDLPQTADVPLLAAERCADVGVDDLLGRRLADDQCTEGQNVHVVVFDRLMCGVVIMDDRRASAGDLVRSDRGTSARPAHDDASLGLAADDLAGDGCSGIWVVDRVGGIRSEIVNEMSSSLKMCDELLFEIESGVI